MADEKEGALSERDWGLCSCGKSSRHCSPPLFFIAKKIHDRKQCFYISYNLNTEAQLPPFWHIIVTCQGSIHRIPNVRKGALLT